MMPAVAALLLLAPLAGSSSEQAPSYPVPFIQNFPAFGTWSGAQLFPCPDGTAPGGNQSASFNASSGELAVGGSCLGVNDNSFGQDGQTIGRGNCAKPGDPVGPDADKHLWHWNGTDDSLRSKAYPTICLHASAARPMAPIIQKTCHSVASSATGVDPRDQWQLGQGGTIRSRANSSLCLDFGSALPPFVCGGETFCDPAQPSAARIKDLVARMDIGEKTLVLNGDNPGVPRLGVPPLTGGDSLHGVGGCGAASDSTSSGCGTSFPHALALAASFNRSLWRMVGDAISTETRGLVNQGQMGMLNPWDPDINLVRDPRWGRNVRDRTGRACAYAHATTTTTASAHCSLLD